MLAVEHNHFSLNFEDYLPNFKQNSSLIKTIKDNIKLFKEIYTLKKDG